MTPPSPHDPLLLLLAAMVIDAVFGDMPAVFAHIPHPIVLAGRAIGFLDAKLNRADRSDRRRREARRRDRCEFWLAPPLPWAGRSNGRAGHTPSAPWSKHWRLPYCWRSADSSCMSRRLPMH